MSGLVEQFIMDFETDFQGRGGMLFIPQTEHDTAVQDLSFSVEGCNDNNDQILFQQCKSQRGWFYTVPLTFFIFGTILSVMFFIGMVLSNKF